MNLVDLQGDYCPKNLCVFPSCMDLLYDECTSIACGNASKKEAKISALLNFRTQPSLIFCFPALLITATTTVFLILLRRRILILLILRHQIIHITLRLRELHLVHSFSGVPMQESLAPKHGRELLANSLKHLLDRGRVSDESRRHLQPSWRDMHDSRWVLTTWSGELQSSETDVVKRLVIEHHTFIGVFDQLGSTTVSETFGDGKTENVSIIRSGYSSRIFEIKSVPIPDPVPPPSE
ncbi:hypothetical protein Ccrd_014291 [Cynara cardunculus var. scolymus]|uniref:Uncharacterized protein n=1 Tax=Cynara cardunculus var. scolymus TaxID=59895 RepID=A0A103YDV6_CYNCS|nr:hypothetical protein Ccrd_014291 [Cynara cardunculus var. scolymus]